MWNLTLGNALLMIHLLEQEREAGHLRFVDGTWRWIGELGISPSLLDLIGHHMGELRRELADVVDILAVAEPLSLEVMQKLVGREAVEEAEHAGLVVVTGDGAAVSLAHPLYGEVRRAQAGNVRLRRLRGSVASVMVVKPDNAHDRLRRAMLTLDSDLEPEPDEMAAAAEIAQWHLDGSLALRLLDAAIANGAGWRVKIARAWLLADMGAPSAISYFAELRDEDMPREGQVSLAFVRAWAARRGSGDPKAIDRLIDEAMRDNSDPESVAVFSALRAQAAMSRGDPTALELAEVTLSYPGVPTFAAALAAISKLTALGELGRVSEMLAFAGPTIELCQRWAATSHTRFFPTQAHAWALELAGCIREARAAVDKTWNVADSGFAQLLLGLPKARVLYAEGYAAQNAQQVSDIIRAAGLESSRSAIAHTYRFWVAEASAISGDRATAAKALRQVEASPCRRRLKTDPVSPVEF
ncbi:MAG: hypothetical protein LLG14_02545 [Nocardiaceae bacterium]|nr:hypothetical protein [Nocardiaceae bacterium]